MNSGWTAWPIHWLSSSAFAGGWAAGQIAAEELEDETDPPWSTRRCWSGPRRWQYSSGEHKGDHLWDWLAESSGQRIRSTIGWGQWPVMVRLVYALGFTTKSKGCIMSWTLYDTTIPFHQWFSIDFCMVMVDSQNLACPPQKNISTSFIILPHLENATSCRNRVNKRKPRKQTKHRIWRLWTYINRHELSNKLLNYMETWGPLIFHQI